MAHTLHRPPVARSITPGRPCFLLWQNSQCEVCSPLNPQETPSFQVPQSPAGRDKLSPASFVEKKYGQGAAQRTLP